MDRMTVAETCEALHISRWTLDRLIKAGQIEVEKEDPDRHNSTVWVLPASVRAYIDRHTVLATSTTRNTP